MRGTAVAIALTLAASSAAADLRADDVWHGWGALLAQMGVLQTGVVMRDEERVTIRGAGAVIELPSGRGQISWRLEAPLVLTEDGHGGVDLSFPRTLPLTITAMLTLPGRRPSLTLSAEITTDGLGWRYSGSPDDMQSALRADRFTIELTELQGGGGADLPLSFVAGFLVAEDVARSTHILIGDSPRLESEMVIGHLFSDLSAEDQTGPIWRMAEYDNLTSRVALTLPQEPIATPALAALLRAGAQLEIWGSADTMRIRTALRDGRQLPRDESQELDDARWSLALTRRQGLDLVLGNGQAVFSRLGEEVMRTGSTMMHLRLPLIARQSVQEALLSLTVDSLRPDSDYWSERAGLPEDTAAEPAQFELVLRARMILTDDLAAPGWLVDNATHSVFPFELHEIMLETLSLSWADAGLTGEGRLTWPEGSAPGPDITAPEGEIVVRAAGLYALLGQMARAGTFSSTTVMGLRGALALFGTPIGPDRIEGHFTFGPDGLRVNGMALPF